MRRKREQEREVVVDEFKSISMFFLHFPAVLYIFIYLVISTCHKIP